MGIHFFFKFEKKPIFFHIKMSLTDPIWGWTKTQWYDWLEMPNCTYGLPCIDETMRPKMLDLFEILIVVVFAIILTFTRYFVQNKAVNLAKSLQIKKQDTRRKFSESVWKVVFYCVSFCWGATILFRSGWLQDTRLFWTNVHAEVGQPLQDKHIQIFYLFELAFYVHSVYAHLVIEVKRSDFIEMLIHHVATTLLVGLSYYARFYRVGIAILVLHDLSDILFDIAKLFVYTEKEFLANLWFGSWVISWAVLRLYLFPRYILYSTFFESLEVMGYNVEMHAFFQFLLWILQILHIFWFGMILSMIVRLVTESNAKLEDTREKDD